MARIHHELEAKPHGRWPAWCVALLVLPLEGCVHEPSNRERYFASRAAFVEPVVSDGELTVTVWPTPVSQPLASTQPQR